MNFLNSNNFAKLSDFVFSEIISTDDFPNNKDLIKLKEIVSSETNAVWYFNPNINLKENDIIFCHTDMVLTLFSLLKNVASLKNLKLITHQSDTPINRKLWQKKPSCISEWYSTNVNYSSEKLISIPLGIGNPYMEIYRNQIEIIKKISALEVIKKDKAYSAFRINTNTPERLKAFFALNGKEWSESPVEKEIPLKYLQNLNSSKFTICPWGNGIDTHRIWESLYLGSIPVTRYHKVYEQFKNYHIIFIKNWKKISLTELINHSKNLDFKKSLEFLDTNYWEDIINKNKLKTNNEVSFSLENREIEKIKNDQINIEKKKKIQKNIRTFFLKFHYLKIKFYLLTKNN